MVNPDGHKFSYEVSRFWRKTRSNDAHAQSVQCPGVDGNRNYDFMWNTVDVSKPSTDMYPGHKPFSEVETRVVDEILKTHLTRITLYLTMHSFSSAIRYPWRWVALAKCLCPTHGQSEYG